MLNTTRLAAPLNLFSALPREARDTLFLLAVIGWILLPQLSYLPLWCSVMAVFVLLWRARLAWRARPMPGRWWLIAATALALGLTWWSHRALLGRESGTTLIVVLLALKTLELRARRDAFVVFFLGFFTLLTHFLNSQSLPTAVAMLIGLLGLLTALVNAHMPVGKPPLLQAARTAVTLAALGAPLMVALFVLFPRVAPLWGVPADQSSGRTGLSDSMRVGAVAKLVQDESIAMRIQFDGPVPAPAALYFRGPVLGGFDGREWTTLQPWLRGSQESIQVQGDPVRYTVTQEPSQRPWLPLLELTPEAPDLPHFELSRGPDMLWQSNRAFSQVVRFSATSYLVSRHGPLQATPAVMRSLYAYVNMPPSANPRTRQWADALRRDERYQNASARDWIDVALTHLSQNNYRYTLEPGEFGLHSADEFWFDKKEGFCEHIASSFVVLMRSLGIPARIVTGYQGGERNALDGYWIIRQSDAHAWVEVWQAGQGWTRVDPTAAVAPGRIGSAQRLAAPPGAIASVIGNALGGLRPDLLNALRDAWDAANNRWTQWVLNYGKNQQFDLLKGLGFDAPSWDDLGTLMAALIATGSLAFATWAKWEHRSRDPWQRLLAQVRSRLEKSGLPVPDHLTPRQIAEAVDQHFGPSSQALQTWLLTLERLRYGPSESLAQTQPLQHLQRQLRTLDWPV